MGKFFSMNLYCCACRTIPKVLIGTVFFSVYFDSLKVEDQIKNYKDKGGLEGRKLISSGKDLGYKKVDKWVAGLEKFNFGMVNLDYSKYSLSGQQMLGLGLKYDWGQISTEILGGFVDYVGRGGERSRAFMTGAGLERKINPDNRVAFQYFVYSPSKSFSINKTDGFFNNIHEGVGKPRIFGRSHILSLQSDLLLFKKYLKLDGNISYASKMSTPQGGVSLDNLDRVAMDVRAESNIDKSPVNGVLGYERVGKD